VGNGNNKRDNFSEGQKNADPSKLKKKGQTNPEQQLKPIKPIVVPPDPPATGKKEE